MTKEYLSKCFLYSLSITSPLYSRVTVQNIGGLNTRNVTYLQYSTFKRNKLWCYFKFSISK